MESHLLERRRRHHHHLHCLPRFHLFQEWIGESVLGVVKRSRKSAAEALLYCEGIVRQAAGLRLLFGLGCTDVVSAEEEASMLGIDLASRVDQSRKTLNEAEVSSLDHPEDVAMTVVNEVLATAEQNQGLVSNAVYVHVAMGVRSVRGCANLLIESPNGMIQPVELW